jgi:hypothetical protein
MVLRLSSGVFRITVAGPNVISMADISKEPSAAELLQNSSLYREFQAEREEILKHKWIESEKAGYDIGFEQALTDWIVRHRSKWRRDRQAHHAPTKTDSKLEQK